MEASRKMENSFFLCDDGVVAVFPSAEEAWKWFNHITEKAGVYPSKYIEVVEIASRTFVVGHKPFNRTLTEREN